MRHSALSQINRENVAKLKVAWVFHTGDISDGLDGRKRSAFETTPILVDGRLFLTTPFNRVIALDPTTGKYTGTVSPFHQNIFGGTVGLFLTGFLLLVRLVPIVSMYEMRELLIERGQQ